jgi:hypothetical protein
MSKSKKASSSVGIRDLVFAGRFAEALQHDSLSTRWKIMCLIGLNQLDEAEEFIRSVQEDGELFAIVYMATIQRIRGDSRAWLLELKAPITQHFEYCLLLRETASHYYDIRKYHLAEEHLERALHMTSHDEDTRQLLPSIAQWYASTTQKLGHDAAAITVLRDGLNIAVAGRRTPLLIELAHAYANLGQLENMRVTLEEIQINPPIPETVNGMIVSYLQAKMYYLEGDTRTAYGAFEALHFGAAEWQSEVAFYAAVECALMQLEPRFKPREDDLEPQAWLMLMRDHASYLPKQLAYGWMACIEAIIVRNPQIATRAAELFKEASAKREECFARALPAVFETDKTSKQASLEHVMRESMLGALEVAEEISNHVPIQQALRFSKNASDLYKYLPINLTAVSGTSLIIRHGKAFRDGTEQRLRRHTKAVQILEMFRADPNGISLDDVLGAVYPESDLENSRKYWNALRPTLEREAGVRFERRKVKGKYLWYLLSEGQAVAVPQKVA